MPHFIQSNCNVKLFRRPQEQPPVTDGVSVIYPARLCAKESVERGDAYV